MSKMSKMSENKSQLFLLNYTSSRIPNTGLFEERFRESVLRNEIAKWFGCQTTQEEGYKYTVVVLLDRRICGTQKRFQLEGDPSIVKVEAVRASPTYDDAFADKSQEIRGNFPNAVMFSGSADGLDEERRRADRVAAELEEDLGERPFRLDILRKLRKLQEERVALRELEILVAMAEEREASPV